MEKKILNFWLLALMVMLGGMNAWAAGYTCTLTDGLEVEGYKVNTFYNFQTNTPEVLPTEGDLRYREGNVWGLHNYASGPRSATATIPVKEGQLLVLQHYSNDVVASINRGTLNETLTASTGYQCYDITATSDDVTFTIARYGGIVAALVMDAVVEASTFEVLYGILDEETNIVAAQGDFAGDANELTGITFSDANGANCAAAMPIDGSVLNLKANWSKNFAEPVTEGKVVFAGNYTVSANNSYTIKIVTSSGYEIYKSSQQTTNGNANQDIATICGTAINHYVRQARKVAYGVKSLVIDLDERKVTYELIASSGNNTFTELNGEINLPNEVTDVKGLSVAKTTYDAYLDNVKFYNEIPPAVKYDYTINYQYEGNTVSSITGKMKAGSVVTADLFVFDDSGVKYYITAEEAPTLTISDDVEQNVLNVSLRKAEDWTYSIKAVVNNEELLTIKTETVIEGETASYGYPQYVAKDGNLYKSAAQSSNPWWGKSFTPNANNETQEISYTQQEETGIVFCKEAEDIESLTKVTGGNTDIRASNRAGAYAAEDAVITTLPAGKYILYAALYGNASTTFNFNAGETTVLELTTSGNPVHTASEEFELTAATDIIVPKAGNAGNSPKIIDYIIIQKTGDVETPVETGDEVVDFDASFYHNWSEVSATATDLGLADGGVVIGEEVALGGTIWGNLTGSVPYLNYANITDYSELRFEGTPGAVLRLMCNRTTDEGPIYEIKPTIGEDGKLTVSISDLKFLNGGTPCDFVCLQSIKVPADWQGGTTAATITSIKIVKPGDPLSIPKTELENAINVAKQQNPVAKSEESFAALTAAIAAAEAALAAADATAESLAAAKAAVEEAVAGLTFADGYSELSKEMFKQYESLENPGEGTDGFGAYELFTASGLPYGDGNVSELKWADLAEYEQLIITTVGEVKPRLCLNRLVAGGQQAATMEESKMLDINPNNEYTWSTEKYLTAENGVYTLNVAAIVADYGFARLHCIKKQGWGAGVVVTGLYLKKAAAPEPQPLTEWDVTYALQEGDTFTSGQTVEVKDDANNLLATITYGEEGGADFKAAKADAHVDGYVAFTEGNGTNGNKAGGTFYTIAPVYDGTISVAVVLNADKAFYVMEDGVALADYDGIKVTEKYYGTYTFDVAAGKSYKFYCAGSKLGFYGFNYKNKSAEPEIVPGDLSGDGEVTVSDAVPVVDYVLGAQEPTEAQKKAADVNKDNEITVSDVSGIVSIALGLWDGTIAEAARGMANNDYVVLNGTEVGLVNANQYVGFQMDVTLAEGAQLNGVSRTARTLGHQVAWNRVGRNTYRIVAFSLASESLSHNEGSLLNLDLKGNQQVALSNIEFTDAQARAYALGLAETTGIGSLNVSTADSQTYTLGGARSNQLQKGVNIVRRNDGQVKKVLVK